MVATCIDAVSNKSRIVIVGAGISGLAAAHRLDEHYGHLSSRPEIIVLDAALNPGGVIRTILKNESVIETGPEAFTTNKPSVVDLCARLGILDRLMQASVKNRLTYVAFDGRLHPLPEGIATLAPTKVWPFLSSSLFSPKGKLRMAMDMVLPPRRWVQGEDESLAQFVIRRFGKEALERLAQPIIGGIYSTCPEMLSMKGVLPGFVDLEQRYGSVIRGLITDELNGSRKLSHSASPQSRILTSFDLGLSVLVEALVKRLQPGSLKTNTEVTTICSGRHGRTFDVVTKVGTVIPSDAVILAIPAHQVAQLVQDIDPVLTAQLNRIPFVSSVVVSRLYRACHIRKPINGSGFVVPRSEMRTIKACTFSSIKFQNRAPEGKMLVRAFIDEAIRKDKIGLAEESLNIAVSEDLKTYLGVTADPVLSLVTRHHKVSPQYQVGHKEVVVKIEEALKRNPGLYLAGNAYNGAGIPDCVISGEQSAMSVVAYLGSMTPLHTCAAM